MICLDIETVPAARDRIEAQMPDEIRNPVMPEELERPTKPDFSEKCPKYASAKDSLEKRAAWIADAERKWQAKLDADIQKWMDKANTAKEAFVSRAALDARLGHAKLVGIRDTDAEIDRVYVWEESAEQASRLMTWYRSLPPHHTGYWYNGRILAIMIFPTEAGMIDAALKQLEKSLAPERPAPFGRLDEKEKCVTYFGHYFDFPFLYRRSWILGVPHVPFFLRGRFYEPYMIDLHDVWQFGDRSEVSGGLQGMSDTLGLAMRKHADSAAFHEVYAKDPSDGVLHLLGDLDMTEGSAQMMGILKPRRASDPLP